MSKVKTSDFVKKNGFTKQYLSKMIKADRVIPKPKKDPVSGWWMIEENAKIIPAKK